MCVTQLELFCCYVYIHRVWGVAHVQAVRKVWCDEIKYEAVTHVIM